MMDDSGFSLSFEFQNNLGNINVLCGRALPALWSLLAYMRISLGVTSWTNKKKMFFHIYIRL